MRRDNSAGRRQLEQAMEQRVAWEKSHENREWNRLRRGWCFGPKEFREELLERIGAKRGPQHSGEELRESDEQKAARLVARMLGAAAWTEEELKRRPKGDPRKARMALRLRQETAADPDATDQRIETVDRHPGVKVVAPVGGAALTDDHRQGRALPDHRQ